MKLLMMVIALTAVMGFAASGSFACGTASNSSGDQVKVAANYDSDENAADDEDADNYQGPAGDEGAASDQGATGEEGATTKPAGDEGAAGDEGRGNGTDSDVPCPPPPAD